MNLLSFVLSVCFMEYHLAILHQQDFVVDFNEAVIEIDMAQNASSLKFICVEECFWVISERIKSTSQISRSGNNLTLIFGEDIKNNVNLTVCRSSLSNRSSIEYYNIPDCCPCCSWYDQDFCDRFSQKYRNCSTIILYFFREITKIFNFQSTYEDVRFLLPCKMRQSHFKENLKIWNKEYNKEYLRYSGGHLQFIFDNLSYNPTSGLCFNTSALVGSSTVHCDYSADNTSVVYRLRVIDFKYKKMKGEVFFVNEGNPKKLLISANQTVVKLLKNQKANFECRGKYEFHKTPRLVLCMKFDLYERLFQDDFFCQTVEELRRPLNIDTTYLKNGSKIICNIENPAKLNSKNYELTLELFDIKVLEILNFGKWNNQTRKVYQHEKAISFTILYDSIPANDAIKCSIVKTLGVQLQGSCSIEVVGECICVVKTAELFLQKTLSIIFAEIASDNVTRSVSLTLHPIYLETPKLIGLDPIFESQKKLHCQSSSSEPYSIRWEIELNINDRYIHDSVDNMLIIPLNDTIKSVCCECTITNELGSESSNRVCQNIIDININPNKTLEIFLVNVTTWNSQLERTENAEYLPPKNHSIEILDNEPINLLCASRNRVNPIIIMFNNSIINSTETETTYTRQCRFQMDIETIKKQNLSGIYDCQQNSLSSKLLLNSSIHIKVLQTITPKIEEIVEFKELKKSYIVGQNVLLPFFITSFPPSKLKITRFSSKLKYRNVTIVSTSLNSSHSRVHITFYNIRKDDSDKYFLIATNTIGSTPFMFKLDVVQSRYSPMIYYIIAGILAIVVGIFGVLFRFIQKSGYAVPIIQIQNSMYKSLDTDSVQLLSNIWPDPLERKKWTIKPSFRVKIIKEIGEGNYGKIYKGFLASQNGTSEQLVALKRPILSNQSGKGKNMAPLQFCQISLDCFMNEIKVLSKLTNCPNIIKMYGCTVFENGMIEEGHIKEPTTLLVLEYCINRSLNEFLTKNSVMFSPYTKFRILTELNGYTGMKMDEGLTLLDLKKISLGIAIGLDYLSGLNIIHRDLATRNILIDDQKNPKICDFGLAIELETDLTLSSCYQIITHSKALPFKILAPEVLESKSFCLESDIWSFGLLLWQMYNLEQEALFPLFDNPGILLKYIRSRIVDDELKELLPVPKYADDAIWKLIKSCWVFEPIDRPSAHLLRFKLLDIVRNSPVEVIRVSNGGQTDVADPICQESISSSKFPSTRTSLVTLNYPILSGNNSSNQNFCFSDEFSSETRIEESPL